MAWEKIFVKIYRIVVDVREAYVPQTRVSIKTAISADFLSRAEIWRKLVTVGGSVRINKQLCWVARRVEGQGGD